MNAAYVLAAVRTPGGKARKGKLKDVRPDDLAAITIKALLERTGIDPLLIDDVILGCAFPEGEQGMNLARVASLKAGLPYQVPAQTVNRFCASGLQSIATAAERIMSGGADCIIAGGAESMSLVPMGGQKFSANPGLVGGYPESYASMGITAELVAEKYGVSRADQDAFAAESHRRAAAAQEGGRFQEELVGHLDQAQRRLERLRRVKRELHDAVETLQARLAADGAPQCACALGVEAGAPRIVKVLARQQGCCGVPPHATVREQRQPES